MKICCIFTLKYVLNIEKVYIQFRGRTEGVRIKRTFGNVYFIRNNRFHVIEFKFRISNKIHNSNNKFSVNLTLNLKQMSH